MDVYVTDTDESLTQSEVLKDLASAYAYTHTLQPREWTGAQLLARLKENPLTADATQESVDKWIRNLVSKGVVLKARRVALGNQCWAYKLARGVEWVDLLDETKQP